MLLPLKQQHPNWECYGFDFSDNAVEILHKRIETTGLAVATQVADLTAQNLRLDFPLADLITVVFVLSSLPPERQEIAVKNIRNLLADGGTVVVRDYGINDHAMTRFGRGCKLGEHFYARQDGTLSYYFYRGTEFFFKLMNAGLVVKQKPRSTH